MLKSSQKNRAKKILASFVLIPIAFRMDVFHALKRVYKKRLCFVAQPDPNPVV